MLSHLHFPMFKRQRETLPKAIASLEALAEARNATRSTVIRVSMEVAHDLRNQLCAVSVLVELTEAMQAAEAGKRG